jgi:hypothetical protein
VTSYEVVNETVVRMTEDALVNWEWVNKAHDTRELEEILLQSFCFKWTSSFRIIKKKQITLPKMTKKIVYLNDVFLIITCK